MSNAPRPFVGLLAGVAARLVASAAMAAFEAQAPALPGGDDEGTAPGARSESGEAMVRYVAGAVIGGIYGLLTEYRPEASAGFGGAYGVATATLLDGTPFAAEPGAAEAPAETRVFGVAAPLVYGVVLEGVRRLIGGRR